jgi:hypothetical protein
MTSKLEVAGCEPSAVLPAQSSAGVRWDGDTSGPRALMLAVLEDAVRCIEEGHHGRRFHARRLAAEAEAWVRSDRTSWPFSFVNICEVLGFDAGAVRGRLLPQSLRSAVATGLVSGANDEVRHRSGQRPSAVRTAAASGVVGRPMRRRSSPVTSSSSPLAAWTSAST